MDKQSAKIPVTVFTGYLGSGKTTMLNHILNNRDGLKVAVIVNDMGEVNIDARVVGQNSALSKTEDKLVSMSNGCICCTLREDLLTEVSRLALLNQFDAILIEASGISEPVPIAQTLCEGIDNNQKKLSDFCFLDAMIAIVDSFRLVTEFQNGNALTDYQENEAHDEKSVIQLLLDQIEFANLIVLNKIDLVSANQLGKIRELVHMLNPQAKLIETSFGQVSLHQVLNTRLFNYEISLYSDAWVKEMEKEYHTPETEEYGISSCVFRSILPFDPMKLTNLLNDWPSTVVRAKGLFWVASEPQYAYTLSQAGLSIDVIKSGYWIAAEDDQEYIEHCFLEFPELRDHWNETYGDRLIELVLIGIDMDKSAILQRLKETVVNMEFESHQWDGMDHPFQ